MSVIKQIAELAAVVLAVLALGFFGAAEWAEDFVPCFGRGVLCTAGAVGAGLAGGIIV